MLDRGSVNAKVLPRRSENFAPLSPARTITNEWYVGERYTMDPRIRGYLEKEIGLTGKQVELVEGTARRLLMHLEGKKGANERPAAAPDEKEVF